MKIRRATGWDMQAIEAAFEGPAGVDLVEMPSGSEWWVVKDAGQVVAFAGAERRDDEVHLTAAYTFPVYRGRRLQQRLIRARIQWARSIGCGRVKTYTWGGALPSIRSLLRCGFVPTSRVWDGERSWLYWSREI